MSQALTFLRAATLALLALAAWVQPAYADAGVLVARATVKSYFTVRVTSQPVSVAVSADDVARGYVDVATPVKMDVEGNDPSYAITFERGGAAFQGGEVQGLGQRVQLDSQAMMDWRGSGRRHGTLEFRFRLRLAAGAAPGEYAWPIQVSMSPA
ncbi:MAG TPA: hypothetical protein VF522_03550 [Ramlibacter sp.]|uniref:hypothetical protein n=1 Tax=Ramlibacter sp. TaxID=1917967 RepID=UPI002ED3270B